MLPERLAKLSAWMAQPGFASALAWTAIGFAIGVLLGAVLDSFGILCARPPP